MLFQLARGRAEALLHCTRMRILVLTHTYPRFSGDTNGPFVEDLCNAHVAAGHEVTVLTAFEPAISSDRAGYPVRLESYRYVWPDSLHVLGYSRTIDADVRLKGQVWLLAPLMLVSAYARLRSLVRSFRPDVLHAHWIVPNGFIAAKVSEATGIPLFCTLHGSDVFTAEKNALYRWMACTAGRRASLVTSCSADLSERLVRLGVAEDRIELVPNGCFAHEFRSNPEAGQALRRQLGIAERETLILALGRLVYKKGFDVLLRAAPEVLARCPEARIVVAGAGELAKDLANQARSQGLGDRVLFPGAVDRHSVPAYFAAADVFTMPSVRDAAGNVDGLPIVVLEAMAAGKPVVASRLSGIPLAVGDDRTGLLVPAGDAPALADALIRLVEDPALRSRLGEAGRARIESELDWSRIAARHREIYQRTLAKGGDGAA